MSVTIKVGDGTPEGATVRLELDVRKSMNGDLMIFDHGDIDIVLSTKNNKITAFPKETMNDMVYGAQNRLFTMLRKKGIVMADSIQGGAFYGAFEALMEEASAENLSTAKMALINISNFIDEERPYFEFIDKFEDMMVDRFVDPDAEHSTELGEIPHDVAKGTSGTATGNSHHWMSYTYE